MASWALLPALSGFKCDADRKVLRFDPAINQDNFRTLFTCGAGWGIYAQARAEDGDAQPSLTLLGGDLEGYTLEAGPRAWRVGAHGALSEVG